MTKARLIKRLKWYYPTERFHTYGTFPFLLLYAFIILPWKETVLLAYGLITCIYILYQGQHYWKLKLNRLTGEEFDIISNVVFFKKSKRNNEYLIYLMPILVLIQLYLINWKIESNGFLWGLFAILFAVLEHINYYHIQLTIDNKYDLNYLRVNRKLKKSSLAKDLDENKI